MSEKEIVKEWFREISITTDRSYRKVYWDDIAILLRLLEDRKTEGFTVIKMKCDRCRVEECETREVLKKHTNPMLEEIIERNCEQFER